MTPLVELRQVEFAYPATGGPVPRRPFAIRDLSVTVEEGALQLGVDAERVKRRVFVGAAVLTASAVAFVGPIGFVGLIVPHALRMTLGPDNRVLVPTAFLGGGLFLLAADTLARTLIAPSELPVGVITSFCGAPFFVYLLRSRSARIAP